jgi:hypothetical protein
MDEMAREADARGVFIEDDVWRQPKASDSGRQEMSTESTALPSFPVALWPRP